MPTRKAIRYIAWTAKKQNCNLLYLNKSFTHIEHRAGAVGRALSQSVSQSLSPHSGIFTSISVGSRPYSNYSLPLRSELFPLRQSVAQNLFEVWRFTFEAGEAELRSVTEIAPKITVLIMWTEAVYPVWFSFKRKSYPVQRKHNLSLITIMRIKSDRPWQDLRECADLIASSVCCIFNRSITTGIFPEEWKFS